MTPWTIRYSRPAERDLANLNAADRISIVRGIQRYAATESGDLKKLQVDKKATWRLRVGDWRVFLDKDTTNRELVVVAVRNRKDSY